MYIEAGRSVAFSGVSNGSDSSMFVLDDSGLSDLAAGNSFTTLWGDEIDTPTVGLFIAPTSGWYYLAAVNYSSIFSETVTWSRTMTRADNVLDYMQMIYNYLQDEGINYITVSSNFFASGQEILLPDEVISVGGGNCVDGTVLFASLLENMGVRPLVLLAPGHAYLGVASAPSGGVIWPLETTMLGSGSPFSDALSCGIQGCVSGASRKRR